MPESEHRQEGYKYLSGRGLEIGAQGQPARLAESCTVEYCDICSKEEAAETLPELRGEDLVDVEHICDLDKDGLAMFPDGAFGFVILNHVLEHLANPIKAVGEAFRVTRVHGMVVLTVPDKDYACDKTRQITPFEHILSEYRDNVTEVTDEHYLDFLRGEHPDRLEGSEEEIAEALAIVRRRRAHAHVWNSEAFKAFLEKTMKLLRIRATCVHQDNGLSNGFEFFSVWGKRRQGRLGFLLDFSDRIFGAST